ncbi:MULTISPECIES: cell division protein FtsZ [unclassified Ruegeria]|uniref:cell division protein FtsZ n=1 Tax=unclassified Ruegeria TaxID=2625375 RepID=UPI001489E619|nr:MULTISPECIES: cell division protein FtsZ [unclassified Ruegeria]NOD74755.1 cell division protein FtsZ [Ruegeria sp. HKCCD4332]NOD88512.1 cell division protein FtsZ [Ruegeria sp. HKCCD4318]NOE12260.1 cell division protein FtsZ [Ruegeria sp. HKCCD4318-2]NOG09575.1 cell division protein FtsZ [Ruegeria sp. HKCCD4315]
MTLNLSMPGHDELKPRITVFGVGGAGGNAVNNMIEKQLDGVDFVVANTDAQALQQSQSSARVQLGVKVTEGLGAGARPTVGAAAAEESIEQIVDHLAGAHMCFITAGMGGGTGTGAAPIIAQAARELGVLTVGVVTKPFQFEGAKRMRQAEDGVEALQKVVDTLIIIPNQNLFRLANEKTTFTEAFSMADDVLYQGVKGVTDLMVRPGLINLDFADVRAVMDEMGKAMMGTGEATGEDRAVQAAEKAIANPLLDEISLKGAKGVLINITGSHDLTLFELDEAANRIREEVDPEANIIVGSTLDTAMEGGMRVSVVATGIDASEKPVDVPVARRSMSEPLTRTVSAEEHIQEDAPVAAEMVEAAPQMEEPREPSLFEAAEEPAQPQFLPRDEREEDDLPPPAYQPRVADFEPQPEHVEPASESFVAPRGHAAGTPSPEALQRLQAAVQKVPSAPQRPAAPRQPEAVSQPEPEERSRFGFNRLIDRMTGHAADTPAQAPRQQPVLRQSEATAPVQDEADPEQDRIEIPAFLRRQAN